MRRTFGELTIRSELVPGDLGAVVRLHGLIYAEEQGWDCTFEAYVAEPLAQFAKSKSKRQRIWLVEREGQLLGVNAIVEASATEAQLRWFLLDPSIRGIGMGSKLIEDAIAFCNENQYKSIFLWTVSALEAAGALYKKFGFQITKQETHEIWSKSLTEERYELQLL